MNASTELRHEHDVLREKVPLLEGRGTCLYSTPAAARWLISILLPFLHAHIDREEASLSAARFSGAMPGEPWDSDERLVGG
jgi:hypothetical protein